MKLMDAEDDEETSIGSRSPRTLPPGTPEDFYIDSYREKMLNRMEQEQEQTDSEDMGWDNRYHPFSPSETSPKPQPPMDEAPSLLVPVREGTVSSFGS
jgi:hypothetical protein